MSEHKAERPTATVTECPLKGHPEKAEAMLESQKRMELAICGDEGLGIRGLVQEMSSLKTWRRRTDLRVASISGTVSGLSVTIVLLVKWWLTKSLPIP